MADVNWIKLKIGMFDDDKIKIIQSMPEGDALLVVWIRLIALAGKTNDGGYVYLSEDLPYTDEMLSVVFNKKTSIIRLALDVLANLKMIELDTKGVYLVNFQKHQNIGKLEEIRDYNKEAQRKSREKRKLLQLVNDMSMTSQTCQDTDIDKDKDKDKELNKDKDIKTYEQQVAYLWQKYPNKKGKATAQKKIPKLIQQYGYEQLERCIDRYCKTDSVKKGYIKQGDTFFNGAYVDYLDENYQEQGASNGAGSGYSKPIEYSAAELTQINYRITDEQRKALDEIDF